MVCDPDISQFLNELPPLSPPPTSQHFLHTNAPIIPPYTTFSHTSSDTTFYPSTHCRTYTMGYNILTRQGYKGLGLVINEHGIKNPIDPPT